MEVNCFVEDQDLTFRKMEFHSCLFACRFFHCWAREQCPDLFEVSLTFLLVSNQSFSNFFSLSIHRFSKAAPSSLPCSLWPFSACFIAFVLKFGLQILRPTCLAVLDTKKGRGRMTNWLQTLHVGSFSRIFHKQFYIFHEALFYTRSSNRTMLEPKILTMT